MFAFVVVSLFSFVCAGRPGIAPHPSPSRLLLGSLLGSFLQTVSNRAFSKRFLLGANVEPDVSGVGGGTLCAGCTGVVAIVQQLAYLHDEVKFSQYYPLTQPLYIAPA